MIYSSWDIEQNMQKLVILGHFLPFYPPKMPQNKNFENEKTCWRHHHFTKNHNYVIYGSWDTEWDRQNILLFWAIFGPFTTPSPSIDTKNQILYIHVYHKWRSCDIWFLKYQVRQTEIFVILGQFLPFQSLDKPKNQNFKIEKIT